MVDELSEHSLLHENIRGQSLHHELDPEQANIISKNLVDRVPNLTLGKAKQKPNTRKPPAEKPLAEKLKQQASTWTRRNFPALKHKLSAALAQVRDQDFVDESVSKPFLKLFEGHIKRVEDLLKDTANIARGMDSRTVPETLEFFKDIDQNEIPNMKLLLKNWEGLWKNGKPRGSREKKESRTGRNKQEK